MPETKSLLLEKARPEDWEDLYRSVWSRPECNRYMFWDLTTDEEAAKERCARTIRWQSSHDAWVIREKESGKVIGFAGVAAEEGTAEEQGVCLSPEYWRRGYGTQVLRALTDHAKTALGTKRFICRARTDNTASRALIEKEGFRFIGEEKVEDHRDGTPRVLAVYEKEL